jgi:hypothetical protein
VTAHPSARIDTIEEDDMITNQTALEAQARYLIEDRIQQAQHVLAPGLRRRHGKARRWVRR